MRLGDKNSKFEVFLFDFDGVLSHDRFYRLLKDTHPHVWSFIQTKLFTKNKDLIRQWMRGEVGLEFINNLISQNTSVAVETINDALVAGAKNFEIDSQLLSITANLRKRNITVVLVTDNMDVFDRFISPALKLERLFDGVVSSSVYHTLKSEGLYQIALNIVNSNFAESILVEDSARGVDYFRSHGGQAYQYHSFEDFESWAKINIL